jgi:transcriptional regulator with GAF, ATPase, and Fis domain
MAEDYSQSDSTVLIQGETETGKELVAKAIHKQSKRADQPLVVVDCTTLPQNLIESILFGIEKSVATGVDARIRKFELASGGMLFFDEIGDLPLDLQPKLLRAIEDKKIERIGSAKPIAVDVRIIVATNKDLQKEIQNHRFRADLFYRLNRINIKLPPLSQRCSDIPLLVAHFIEQKCQLQEITKTDITREALKFLTQKD